MTEFLGIPLEVWIGLISSFVTLIVNKFWDSYSGKKERKAQLKLDKMISDYEAKLDKFYWPIYIHLSDALGVIQHMRYNNSGIGCDKKIRREITRRLETKILIPIFKRVVKIIKRHMSLCEQDELLYGYILRFTRYVQMYQTLRTLDGIANNSEAIRLAKATPESFGITFPEELVVEIETRTFRLNDEYDQLIGLNDGKSAHKVAFVKKYLEYQKKFNQSNPNKRFTSSSPRLYSNPPPGTSSQNINKKTRINTCSNSPSPSPNRFSPNHSINRQSNTSSINNNPIESPISQACVSVWEEEMVSPITRFRQKIKNNNWNKLRTKTFTNLFHLNRDSNDIEMSTQVNDISTSSQDAKTDNLIDEIRIDMNDNDNQTNDVINNPHVMNLENRLTIDFHDPYILDKTRTLDNISVSESDISYVSNVKNRKKSAEQLHRIKRKKRQTSQYNKVRHKVNDIEYQTSV